MCYFFILKWRTCFTDLFDLNPTTWAYSCIFSATHRLWCHWQLSFQNPSSVILYPFPSFIRFFVNPFAYDHYFIISPLWFLFYFCLIISQKVNTDSKEFPDIVMSIVMSSVYSDLQSLFVFSRLSGLCSEIIINIATFVNLWQCQYLHIFCFKNLSLVTVWFSRHSQFYC